jgi:hypothetical protein
MIDDFWPLEKQKKGSLEKPFESLIFRRTTAWKSRSGGKINKNMLISFNIYNSERVDRLIIFRLIAALPPPPSDGSGTGPPHPFTRQLSLNNVVVGVEC